MRRSSDLEARLSEWADEYGGSRYDNTGWQGVSQLAGIIKYHGRAPQGLNPSRVVTNGAADEVEAAVRALAAQKSGVVPAAVLRCDYYSRRNTARAVRIQRLGAIGHSMGGSIKSKEARYCQHLRTAKIHVAAWLRIPFDAMLSDEDAVDMLDYVVMTDA